MLCLYPNCHVLLDDGAIVIQDDMTITSIGGKLRAVAGHTVTSSTFGITLEHWANEIGLNSQA